ncbi:beta-lactamase family protein [Novosphingobium profundi]|uniref:serine hydrolase domain-containing protein n=1 Tax=Novosphingobium profundi TaxID=1774954 RepID=UPI001BD9351B|nr:serine hydrolase domain-containing protein [Novosphingobium profundi]MBT0669272.1 beta-lactamase family protein [Novosphingobium profundi]
MTRGRTKGLLAAGLIATLAAGGSIGLAQAPEGSGPPRADAASAAEAPAPGAARIVLPPSTPAGAHALEAADVDAWLDGYMPFALHSKDIAGAVVTVVKDGQIVAARGYGYADIVKRTPVDPATTLFRPGSVSKLVTWTAVMQQVEAGKIDLDADVNTYLDFTIPPRNGQPITMQQIMTHTAGFEEAMKDLITDRQDGLIPLGTYLKRWTPTRIFDAGTTPAYSNWATSLAGYVVERTSGMSFDAYVEAHIFRPLDMTTASFRQPLPANLKPLVATGYPRASQDAQPFEVVIPAPAGSLSASGLDMAKFMIAHLENGRGLLRPQTAAMMHDSPLAKVNPASLVPPLNRMELGFFETNINGRDVIAHLGDTNNFHTSLHLFRKEGVGFYVSFNSAGKEGGAHTVRQQLFQDFADRYFPALAPASAKKVDASTAAAHARMISGLWDSSRRGHSNFVDILNLFDQTEVGVDKDGGLRVPALTSPGGGVETWDEVEPFVWHERGGHDRLAAQVVDGRVVRWSFDLVAPFTVFDRVSVWRSSAWLLPAIYASLAILLLTFLSWPVSAFARWRFGAPLKVEGKARTAYRATRLGALLTLAAAGGWTAFIISAFSNLSVLSAASDGLLWFLKGASGLAFVGMVVVAVWNAALTWRDGRGWLARSWSGLVVLAALVPLYVALVFHLLVPSVMY